LKLFQSRVWLIVAVLAALLFIGVLVNPRFNVVSVSLDNLIFMMQSGQVEEVVVRNETDVTARYLDGTTVRTTKPADMNLLEEAHVEEGQLEKPLLYREEGPNPVLPVLRAGALIILPLIALTALYVFYIGRVNAAKAQGKTS